MISGEERIVRKSQGYDIGFESCGKKIWINSSDFDDDKRDKLLAEYGIISGIVSNGSLVFMKNDAGYTIGGNGAIRIERNHSPILEQPMGLSDYSMLFYDSNVVNLVLTNWEVKHIKSFYRMFANCKFLRSVVIDGWDMSSVESIDGMFSWCPNLLTVSMRNCKFPRKVTDLFYCDNSLINVRFSTNLDRNFGIEDVKNFKGCTKLSQKYGISDIEDRFQAGLLFDALMGG